MKKENGKYATKEKFILFLILTPILFIIIPTAIHFIFYITNPFTPAIKGIVVEEGTRKPIQDVNVRAEWYSENILVPVGATYPRYNYFQTTTNNKGEFALPKTLKPIPLWFFPLYVTKYGGIYIRAFSADHVTVISGTKNDSTIEIIARPYKNADEYLKDILGDYPYELKKIAIAKFEDKYKYSNIKDIYNISRLADHYKDQKQYAKAIKALTELHIKDPNYGGKGNIEREIKEYESLLTGGYHGK